MKRLPLALMICRDHGLLRGGRRPTVWAPSLRRHPAIRRPSTGSHDFIDESNVTFGPC